MILDIGGSLQITIYGQDGVEVSSEVEQRVIKDLNSGELYFNLNSKKIVNTDFEDVFTVEYEVLPNTEYNFE